MSMRGLTVFIADLRKCRIHELEEKRINKEMANIRAQFKQTNLKGYQKKKYVCKLLYMYILGWDIDFGHAEAVSLISSDKFSEKQMGYLAITLLLTENSELIRLVINSLRKDLDSQNELFNCLALHAIANTGGREMAETLAREVQKLLISPMSKGFVKKKAALCLLRLFRKHSDVLPAVEWAERILPIMDDPDVGVVTSAASLITALAQQYPQQYAMCVPKAIRKLQWLVMESNFPSDYIYYKVPAPWLQVKLLRLLQYYPIPDDEALRQRILDILHCIIQNSREIPRNVQHANALHAILFETINLVIHFGCEPDLLAQAAALLGRFIASKETNVRYLGLETMAHLAGALDNPEPIRRHQELILASLRDRDVSVRRRGLDLLYSMCDVSNSRAIVRELLRYLPMADFALREEMVLKIAILTEKFATEYQWYVDTIIKLLSTAGDQVGEEIWHRLIQIVLGNEGLQEYAARVVLSGLRAPHCPENALKVGAYVLGEFGHLIANEPGCSPMDQFKSLHARFSTAPLATKVMLLTTYLKFVNLFPEIKEPCLRVFERYRYALDVELQQRACEYYHIVNRDTDELLQTVCEEMPPYPARESSLVSRLQRQYLDTEDKRTWVVGGKEANLELKSQDAHSAQAHALAAGTAITNATLAAAAQASAPGPARTAEVNLLNLDEDLSHLNPGEGGSVTGPDGAPEPVRGAGHVKLLTAGQGVLYEDDTIQLGVKSEYHGYQGRLVIYTGNQTGDVLTSFAITVHGVPHVKATTVQAAPTLIQPFAQAPYLVNLECHGAFDVPPHIHVTFGKGGTSGSTAAPVSLHIQLPVSIAKFIEPFSMAATDFFQRWRQLSVNKRESQAVFSAREPFQPEPVRALLRSTGLALLTDADPNPNNFVGVGILVTTSEKVGCLLRLEPSKEHQMYRITVRTTNENFSEILRHHVEDMVNQIEG